MRSEKHLAWPQARSDSFECSVIGYRQFLQPLQVE